MTFGFSFATAKLHRLRLLGVGLLLSSTVCADVYPESAQIDVHISTGTISTWTETAAQDYLISDSQVFVTRPLSTFGLYGGGILGTLLARGTSASALGNAEPLFRLSFAAELEAALKKKMAARSTPRRLAQVADEKDAHVILLPSAMFTEGKEGKLKLAFRVHVRIRDAKTGEVVKTQYGSGPPGEKPPEGPGGWSESNAAGVREAAGEAFGYIADELLNGMFPETVAIVVETPRPVVKPGDIDCGPSAPAQPKETYLRLGKTFTGLGYYQDAMACLLRAQEEDDGSDAYKQACAAIGTLYELGWGVEKDMPTAMRWFEKAGL